jgi:hypothetical protein
MCNYAQHSVFIPGQVPCNRQNSEKHSLSFQKLAMLDLIFSMHEFVDENFNQSSDR